MTDNVYTAELKKSLTGSSESRFVWLCNFEVENQWARSYVGLPSVPVSVTTSMVQRMEELGALLAEPSDLILLDRPLDSSYRHYADKIGLGTPTELVTQTPAAAGGTSQAVLESPDLLRRLRELAQDGAWLMPMGNSAAERRITEITGLRPAVPTPEVHERVNSKIYSRRLVEELGLRSIPGYCCENIHELRGALEESLSSEGSAVIVKDAYGVSGKGLIVLDSRKRAERLLAMVDRRARQTGDASIHVVVESFLPKQFDVNYQFTIDRGGAVRFDFVKQALTSGGVHLGHVSPAALTGEHVEVLNEAARKLGARLYADGYFGVVGVDALLGADDLIYPVLEINARLNMSTYQGRVVERFQRDGGAVLAKHYSLRLNEPVSFDAVAERLESSAWAPAARAPADGTGLVITCFGTVNAQAATSSPFDGRLYTLLFADDRDGLAALDDRVEAALASLAQGRTS